jgi:hypothetical protein
MADAEKAYNDIFGDIMKKTENLKWFGKLKSMNSFEFMDYFLFMLLIYLGQRGLI